MFLKPTPNSDLLEVNFSVIDQMTNCMPRHLYRFFRKLMALSFNDQRSGLRLSRELDLPSTSQWKVVDVALSAVD